MQWDGICHVLLNYCTGTCFQSTIWMSCRNIVCHDITNLYMYSNLTSYWTMMANNGHYMLNEYDNLHIGQKTMATLVYQMKTNKRPSLLATNLIVPR